VPVADDIWEWSRYFVVRERRSGRTDCRLLAAIQQFALEEGLTQLQAIVETWWLPRWHEAGFRVRPLGLPTLIENRWSIAALIDVSADTLNRVRDFAGLTGDTLIREGSQGSTTRGIIHAA
jgi:acyl-homoserine lactone synthase